MQANLESVKDYFGDQYDVLKTKMGIEVTNSTLGDITLLYRKGIDYPDGFLSNAMTLDCNKLEIKRILRLDAYRYTMKGCFVLYRGKSKKGHYVEPSSIHNMPDTVVVGIEGLDTKDTQSFIDPDGTIYHQEHRTGDGVTITLVLSISKQQLQNLRDIVAA